MKLSFLPGDLHLSQTQTGHYVVALQGQEILRTKSRCEALARFNSLRHGMEFRFPKRELTAEEKAEIMKKAIGDSLVGHNSLGGRKKKTTAGGTRTFGG
jgi:hypothetical protein